MILTNMKMIPLKKIASVAVLCGTLAVGGQSARAALVFEEDFDNGNVGNIPATPEANFNNWYAQTASSWYWNGNAGASSNAVFFATTTGANGDYILRNLRDGVLSSEQVVSAPDLSSTWEMAFGGNSDPNLKYGLLLLDVTGNGYAGIVGRNGALGIYELNNGISGAWDLLASNTSASEANRITLSLSVNNGEVSLTSSSGGLLSIADSSYSSFVTIGAGTVLYGGVQSFTNDVTLNGDIVSVPEPSTTLCFAVGILVLGFLSYRQAGRKASQNA